MMRGNYFFHLCCRQAMACNIDNIIYPTSNKIVFLIFVTTISREIIAWEFI
jgi:hypothetical protein